MRRPGSPLPLPAGQHHLEGGADRGGFRRQVDERERLARGQRRGRGGQHRVAGPGRGGRAAEVTDLGQDPRPGRVTCRLAQVDAALTGRAPRHRERPHHPDGLVRVDHQVRHAVPGERGKQYRVGPAGQHRQVGQPGRVVSGAGLRCHPAHRAGRPGRAGLAHVVGAEARGHDVGRLGDGTVGAAHPADTGGGEERGDAGAYPSRTVDPGEGRPPPREHRRTAVGVPVGEGGAGQLGPDPRPQVVRERGPQAGREVVEQALSAEQFDDPVHDLLADAELGGGPLDLGHLPRPVEQAHDGRRPAEPGQGPGAARVDPDLQRARLPPQRPQPGFHRWSHRDRVTWPTDFFRRGTPAPVPGIEDSEGTGAIAGPGAGRVTHCP